MRAAPLALARRALLAGLMAAPATRSARALEAVSFLFPAPSYLPAFVPHWLAEKRGYYAAQGLAVTFRAGRGGADAAKQVAVGNVDLGGGVGETAMIVRANGLPVRGVGLLGGKSLYRIAARQAAGIATLADLRGKRIGVIGYQDTGYYTLLSVLASFGIRRNDARVQAVGAAGMTQLMIAGSLDAIMAVPEWSVMIESAGVKLDTFSVEPVIPSMAQAVLASDAIIRRRPLVVRGFVGAVLHAVRDCMADPASAARDFVAAVPQQRDKVAEIEVIIRRYVKDVYPTDPPSALGRFDPARLRKVEQLYLANGIIQTAVPVEELYTNDFVG
jgi:NitT/TauT family transport system substrate-binding protein